MPDKALEVFSRVEHPNDVIVNLLLNTCAQLKTADALQRVRSVASKISTSACKNVYLLTSLLDALMKCGDVAGAQSLFDAITTKTVTMYGAMMKGKFFFQNPNKHAIPFSLIGYLANAMPDRAIDLYARVESPDDVIIILFLNACAQLGTVQALDLVRKVVSEVPKASSSNAYIVTSLLDALMKCRDMANAQLLFDKSITKTLTMYSAMMKGNFLNHAAKPTRSCLSCRLHSQRFTRQSH
jgi:hypothetical protein